ncbi:MAG: serine/threonine-protein kinase [Myxococcota bacterium]
MSALHDFGLESLAPGSGLVRVCRLAEGGMARVDLAIKRVGTFRRMYAVKRLHPHLASDPEFRAMFLDEARIAGLIRHPNVVGVLDVGEDTLGPFLVMDYVDGLPLGNLLARVRQSGDPMPVQVAVRIALDVAQGLYAAHAVQIEGKPMGVVHRDLSPQNIMVGFDGQARLTDFGIAKALGRSSSKTATGVVKGKTAYLSPEQIRLEEPDQRSDLFSLGVVIFEMLSGDRLYRRESERANMQAILEEPVPDVGELRSDVPDELVRLLFELLAKEKDARPPDANEVATRLERVLAELIQEEEPVRVSDFVALMAGEAKAEQARVLAEAMEEAERTQVAGLARDKTPSPIAPPVKRARGWVIGLGAVVAIAVGIAIFGARTPSAPAPVEPPKEAAAIAPPAPTPEPPAPSLEAAASPSPSPTPTVAKEDPRPKARRPNPRRPSPKPGASPIPDWVEFGK